MATNDAEYTAVFCEDGQFQIREVDNPDGWIATDSPESLVP